MAQDFSFENILSSKKQSCAEFSIFIKISYIKKQTSFNFNNRLTRSLTLASQTESLQKEILNQR